jgi:SAM-dependent methyltransferase
MLNSVPQEIIRELGFILRKYNYCKEVAENHLEYKFGNWLTAFAPAFLFPLFVQTLSKREFQEPIDVCLQLFYCCYPISEEQSQKIFGVKLHRELLASKLLQPCENRSGMIEATIQIIPFFDGLVIATEKPLVTSGMQYLSFAPQAVMTLFSDSYDLASKIRTIQAATAVDLFCGNGVQSLILAKNGVTKVLGIDVNEKALAFAQFNAVLNDLHEKIIFKLHDLTQPIDMGRFDVVVANPPFCPAPSQCTFFCDGGITGDFFVKMLLHSRLPEVISDGGRAFIIFSLALCKGEVAESKIASFYDNVIQCNSNVTDLSSAASEQVMNPLNLFLVYFIASRCINDISMYPAQLQLYLEHFSKIKIDKLQYCLLDLSDIQVKQSLVLNNKQST